MKIPFLTTNRNIQLLEKSVERITNIRKKHDILVICALPTEYSWLGVNVATKSLFPQNTYEIPQYYSNSIFSIKEIQQLVVHINNLQFKQVIYSGFAPFYEQIVLNIYTQTIQKVIYHGFLAELSENTIQQHVFKRLMELTQVNKIKALGFVKKGLALSVMEKYKIPTFEIILPNLNIKNDAEIVKPKSLKIGCLVNTSFRKNIHNMVFAASMIENAEMHVFRTNDLDYLDNSKIVQHDLMSHESFVQLLASMTMNLHVTFSEGMGGQVCAESISQGIPCISANTSSFFDYDEDLKEKLIVDGFDDSWHIYNKINLVLQDWDSLSKKCIHYSMLLNKLSYEKLNLFLNS
jgi:hypothetical protein